MTHEKVVLAYSGGLDTSVIVPWLKENYDCEVIAMLADVGQGEDLEAAAKKGTAIGASKTFIEDLRTEFVRDYVFPALRAGARYEHDYLLGTSLARPIIAKRQVEIALAEGAAYVAHGCTGKGNDQVRFELTYQALAPELKVIAPWREWDIRSREDALAYAEKRGIPVAQSKENIYSRDQNLLHLSHEGGALEDPWTPPLDNLYQISSSPAEAPAEPLLNRVGDGRHAARFGNRDEGHAAVAFAEPLEDRAAVFVPITEEVVENHELGALARYAARQASCTFHDADGALFAKGFVKRRGDIAELTRRWVQNNYCGHECDILSHVRNYLNILQSVFAANL